MDKETSDLSLSRKECPRCKAIWINDKHIWSGTGCQGDEQVLHNLVCNQINDPQCINPAYKKGEVYENKDSWEKRRKFIDRQEF
jgi:hypothetical protein